MNPITAFVREFKDHIIEITCFAKSMEDNQEITIEVQDIKIGDEFVYFIGKEEVLNIPIDGAIIDLDYDKGVNNLLTIFNKKYGYIKTKRLPFLED